MSREGSVFSKGLGGTMQAFVLSSSPRAWWALRTRKLVGLLDVIPRRQPFYSDQPQKHPLSPLTGARLL